jgi:hypothetical protein
LRPASYNRWANNQTKEINIGTSTGRSSGKRRTDRLAARPVKTFKEGGVEVSVWRNSGEQGDIYNATIRKSYKDEKSGDWKETTSLSPTDLAVVSQLSSRFRQAAPTKAKRAKVVEPACAHL